MMSFDRFTERAQEAAKRAYEVLIHYKHTQLDTEHIFLALVQQTDGTVSELLRRQDADPELIARKLEGVLDAMPKSSSNPYGASPTAQVFITPRLKRILDDAAQEAQKL